MDNKEVHKVIMASENGNIESVTDNESHGDNNNFTKSDNNPKKEVDGADRNLISRNSMGYNYDEMQPLATVIKDNNKHSIYDVAPDYNRDFVGLSREELLKYANDPYWIRLRWIFFLGFWLVWFIMLFIAIIIVIYTPKCSSPNDLWWNTGVFTESFTDNETRHFLKLPQAGNFEGLILSDPNSINDLKITNIHAVLDLDVVQLFYSNRTWATNTDDFIIRIIYEQITTKFMDWIEKGFQGFRLKNIPESIVKVNENRVVTIKEGLKIEIFTYLRDLVKRHTNGNGVFIGQNIGSLQPIFDLVQVAITNQDILTAESFEKKINQLRSKSPLWKVSNFIKNNGFLDIIICLLPGTPLIHNSHLLNETLLQLRKHPSVLSGGYKSHLDGNIFSFQRYLEGQPTYLVLLNLGTNTHSFNLTSIIDHLSHDFEVAYVPNGVQPETIINKNEPNMVNLPELNAVILSYIP